MTYYRVSQCMKSTVKYVTWNEIFFCVLLRCEVDFFDYLDYEDGLTDRNM
jgi:hypothetical protein